MLTSPLKKSSRSLKVVTPPRFPITPLGRWLFLLTVRHAAVLYRQRCSFLIYSFEVRRHSALGARCWILWLVELTNNTSSIHKRGRSRRVWKERERERTDRASSSVQKWWVSWLSSDELFINKLSTIIGIIDRMMSRLSTGNTHIFTVPPTHKRIILQIFCGHFSSRNNVNIYCDCKQIDKSNSAADVERDDNSITCFRGAIWRRQTKLRVLSGWQLSCHVCHEYDLCGHIYSLFRTYRCFFVERMSNSNISKYYWTNLSRRITKSHLDIKIRILLPNLSYTGQ